MQEPKTVLVVEDNPTIQKLVVLFARKLGVATLTAGSSQEALSLVHSGQQFDLVFMDWSLPDESGLECAKKIREFYAASGTYVPIVAMTANLMAGDREQCLSSGMADFLGKPFSMAEFKHVVERWLQPDRTIIPFPETGAEDKRSAGNA